MRFTIVHRIFFLFVIQVLYFLEISAQTPNTIKGKIVNSADGKPIPKCSIFINNSSIGTSADENGEFELTNIPAGQHELVISSIGFERVIKIVNYAELPLKLNVSLKLK